MSEQRSIHEPLDYILIRCATILAIFAVVTLTASYYIYSWQTNKAAFEHGYVEVSDNSSGHGYPYRWIKKSCPHCGKDLEPTPEATASSSRSNTP